MDKVFDQNDGLSDCKRRRWYAINKRYVPLKLMYFFFVAGQACSIVYRSIFMRHLGLSTHQTGMIWMIERVIAMVAPYVVGGFTDKTRTPKAVLLGLIIGGALTVSSMYFIPPEEYVKSDVRRPISWEEMSTGETSFCCDAVCKNSYCSLSNPRTSVKSCHSDTMAIRSFQCQTFLKNFLSLSSAHDTDFDNKNSSISWHSSVTIPSHPCLDTIFNTNSSIPIGTPTRTAPAKNTPSAVINPINSSLPNSVSHYSAPYTNFPNNIYCANGSSNKRFICYETNNDKESSPACDAYIPNPVDEYGVTFWLLTILMLASCLTGVGIFPVLEATTLGVLGKENRHKYGHQRLWASVGYGITAVVIGYVKDGSAAASGVETMDNREFLPMFVGLLVCWCCAALVTLKLPIKQEKSTNKVKLTDIKIVLKNPRAVAFYGVLLVYGMTNTIHQIYLFWLFEEKLNAPSFVLGIATMIGSFSDIPFCLSAGFLIKKFGHTPLICFGTFIYAIRISSAALIVDYWQLLATESLRGMAWGLTWVVICSYTNKISPKGLENSTMGITQGLMRGVAGSIGALLGGVIYQARGGEFLFLIFGLTNVIATALFGIFICATRKSGKRKSLVQGDGASELMTMEVDAKDSIRKTDSDTQIYYEGSKMNNNL